MTLLSQCTTATFLSLVIAILLGITIPSTYAANILAVFPSVWKSHYLFGRAILEELAATHHHNVTLISAFKTNWETTKNLPQNQSDITEINVEGIEKNWEEMGLSMQIDEMHEKSVMERFTRLVYAGASTADLLLSSKQMKNLLQSNVTFDLLVVDLFLSDALLGLAQFYNIPTVVLSPTGPNTWLNEMTGNNQNSAMDPSNFLPYCERMSLGERIINTLMSVFEKLTYNFFHMIAHQAVYKRHFEAFTIERNEVLRHHRDLTHNISLVLLNSHPVVQYPRSFLPNVIEVGGVHFRDEKLPEHLLRFIEDATDGVVYVSFGANIKTCGFSEQKLDILLHALETLKETMRVLLKWEDPEKDHRTKNIFTSEWFPQQAVLAHPNVKLFISSAGLMSVFETIQYRTPMLAIPILAEQVVNAKRLENRGCGLSLPYENVNYDTLLDAIDNALSNSTLSSSIATAANLLNEDIQDPMSRAMYYIHMVLRTSGADHLKSHANNLGFFRSELVDVLLIILAGFCVIIAVPFVVICAILRRSDHTGTRGPGRIEPITVAHRFSNDRTNSRRESFRKSSSREN